MSELAPLFADRSTRINALPEQARESFQTAYNNMPETERDTWADKQFSSVWLSQRLGVKREDVASNWDALSAQYFGDTDPAKAYDAIGGYYASAADKRVRKEASAAEVAAVSPLLAVEGLGRGFRQMGAGVEHVLGDTSQVVGDIMQKGAKSAAFEYNITDEERSELMTLRSQRMDLQEPQEKIAEYQQLLSGELSQDSFEDIVAMREASLQETKEKMDTLVGSIMERAGTPSRYTHAAGGTLKGYGEEASRLGDWIMDVDKEYGDLDFISQEARETIVGKFSSMAGESFPIMASLMTGATAGLGFSQMYEQMRDAEKTFIESRGEEFDQSRFYGSRMFTTGLQLAAERALGIEQVLAGALKRTAVKTAKELTLREIVKQSMLSGIRAGIAEAPEEMIQGTLEEIRRKTTYDVDFDMNLKDFVERRGIEGLYAMALGFTMGGAVDMQSRFDVRKEAKKVLAKDGMGFSRQDWNQLRRLHSDEDLRAMAPEGMEDTYVGAANGDQAAFEAYEEYVYETVPAEEVIGEAQDYSKLVRRGEQDYIVTKRGSIAYDESNPAHVQMREYIERTGELGGERVDVDIEAEPLHIFKMPAQFGDGDQTLVLLPTVTGEVISPEEAASRKEQGLPTGVLMNRPPEIRLIDGEYEILDETGVPIETAEPIVHESDAVEIARGYMEERSLEAPQTVTDFIGYIQEARPEIAAQYFPERMDGPALERHFPRAAKTLKRIISAEGYTGIEAIDEFDSRYVLGMSSAGFEMGFWDQAIRIFKDGTPLTVVEEVAEDYLKARVRRFGDMTYDELRTWRTAIEAQGIEDTVNDWSDGGMTEWWSDRAIEYITGRVEQETAEDYLESIPQSFRGFLSRLRIYATNLFKNAARLMDMRERGVLPEGFESRMEEALGLRQRTQDPVPLTPRTNITPEPSTQSFQTDDGRTLTGPATFQIAAYHGTPHKVDKFRTENIGTGEGAQAYGYGLYFAESEDVARSYREGLSADLWVTQDKEIAEAIKANPRATDEEIADMLYDPAESAADLSDIFSELDELGLGADDAKNLGDAGRKDFIKEVAEIRKRMGSLYTVSLNVEEDELLDWDAPLSGQSQIIEQLREIVVGDIDEKLDSIEERFEEHEDMPMGDNARRWIDALVEDVYDLDALRDAQDVDESLADELMTILNDLDILNPEATGSQAYSAIQAVIKNDEKAASAALHAAGIKGIRYLDGSSRSAGEGTRNYVIFNDADITITEENGKPVSPTFQSVTETPAFQAWFGDSKVVDENGEPLVMYHATDADFDRFQRNSRGLIFGSTDPEWASDFITERGENIREGINIIPVYMKAENPFDYEVDEHVDKLAVAASLGDLAIAQIKGGDWTRLEDRSTLKAIKSLGFDGVYVEENYVKNLGVFNPTQIKSAYNRGTFDPQDPRISFQAAEGGPERVAFLAAEEQALIDQQDRIWDARIREERKKQSEVGETLELEFSGEQSGFLHGTRYVLMTLGSRLRNVHLGVFSDVRRHRFEFNRRLGGYSEAIQPAVKLSNKLNRDDRKALGLALSNRDLDAVNELASKVTGLRDAMNRVFTVLEDVRRYAIQNGFDVGYLEDYWPRLLKDRDGLLNSMGLETRTTLEDMLAAAEQKRGSLSEDEKDMIVSNWLTGTLRGSGTPANFKGRKIDTISMEQYADYYGTAWEALEVYLNRVVSAVETRRFFGKAVVEETYEVGDIESEGVDEAGNIVVKRVSKKKTARRRIDIDKSIARRVRVLVEKGELTSKDQDEIKSVLSSLFAQRATPGFVSTLRTLGYISTMTKFTNAITQLEDITTSLYLAGVPNTVKSFAAYFGKSEVELVRDFGLEAFSQDHKDAGRKMTKTLDKLVTFSGLKFLGRGGAASQVNAALIRYRQSAKEGIFTMQQERRIHEYFAGDVEQILKLKEDLASGEKTELTELLGWNILMDNQPLDISELPEGYSNHPVLRWFYMLKSFTVKRLDIYRRESIRDIRIGVDQRNYSLALAGLRRLLHLYLLYFMGGMSVDWIKSMIRGNETTVNDAVMTNMAVAIGLSRYAMVRGLRDKSVWMWAAYQVAPPVPFIEAPAVDLHQAFKEDSEWSPWSSRSLSLLPFVSDIYQHRFGYHERREREKARKKRKQERGF